jgi:hypothetical protein
VAAWREYICRGHLLCWLAAQATLIFPQAVLQSDMYVTVWTMQLQMCNQPALPNAAAVSRQGMHTTVQL